MTRAYGPHDPETAPTTVLLHEAPNGVRSEREVRRPAAAIKQRRDINNLAWEAGKCPSSS